MMLQYDLIHNMDWRNVIILDACRYDYFKETVNENKYGFQFEPVWSPGGDTGRWYTNMWVDGEYDDTILVSDSPVPWRRDNGMHQAKFYRSYPLWKNRGKTLGEFPPLKELIEQALKYKYVNKNKRMLLHLVPPHLPYYHDEGIKLLLKEFGKNVVGDGMIYLKMEDYGKKHGWDKVITQYKKSIEFALDTILKYDWGEQTIVTSDHGELIGEGKRYTHSLGFTEDPLLRTVPWASIC